LLIALKENIMNHGSLFSGIGGFDLAAEWMGWENKFHCDINPFSRKLCSFYWPEAQSYDNIKTTDFRIWRGKIDVLSGGFPCQPFSTAGKRMGKEDDRHLWPEMLRAISSDGRIQREPIEEGAAVRELRDLSTGGSDRVHLQEGNNTDTTSIGPHRQKHEQKLGSTRWSKFQFGKSKIKRNVTDTERSGLEYGNETRNVHSTVSETQGKQCKSPDDIKTDDNVCSQQGGPSEAWGWFPTKSPLCSGDDGLPNELDGLTFPKWRKESIMGYGNAIVPQIAYRIFATIDETDN